MAELSVCLSNIDVSLERKMEVEKSSNVGKDCQTVEIGEMDRQKVPRRVIHFASGETMEEYSTDEEGEEETVKKDLLTPVEPSKLTWGPYFWFHMWRAATSTVSACDYLGEKMAAALGITSAKYQYAIDEYYRTKKEEEEEEEDNRLSEEAERRFQEQQRQEGQGPLTEQPDGSASIVNVTCEVVNEPHTISDVSRVSAPVPS